MHLEITINSPLQKELLNKKKKNEPRRNEQEKESRVYKRIVKIC